MRLLPVLLVIHGALVIPAAARGQTTEDHLARGIELHKARDPQGAFEEFAKALEQSPKDYEANWRAAEALVDVGKQTPDSVKSPTRDSLYAEAEGYARTAVEANPDGAMGHYTLALAIGRASLTKSKKERVRRAGVIRTEVLRSLEIDSTNDKAYHLLGRWHAEIMRLSGFTRFFAKAFLGGGVFGEASWDKAIENMDRAVSLAPQIIYHHLDLAEVLVDRKRYAEARIHLERIKDLPLTDAMDVVYRQDADRLLTRIAGRPDGK